MSDIVGLEVDTKVGLSPCISTSRDVNKCLHTHIHSSSSHNSQKVKTTQGSSSRRTEYCLAIKSNEAAVNLKNKVYLKYIYRERVYVRREERNKVQIYAMA